jgi:hypothetical protein
VKDLNEEPAKRNAEQVVTSRDAKLVDHNDNVIYELK